MFLSNKFAWLSCAAVLVALLLPSRADAQGWLEDRSRAEGPGFRVGNLELHPGVGAEIGYDNNVFYSENPVGSALLRVTPHLYLSTLGEQRTEDSDEEPEPPTVKFQMGLHGSLYHYFATSARTDVGIAGDVRLDILPERPFSISVFDTLARNVRPFTESGAANNNYARIRNDAGIELGFQSRGGVLSGHVGYTFGLDYFEGATFQYANAFTHNINAGAAWKFLPQTALLYDSRTEITNYTSTAAAPVLRSDQVRLRNRIGVNGALTNNISALVMIGHAAGFYQLGDDYDDLVAQAELRFTPSETLKLAIGYDRDVQRSTIGNFFRRDRGYVSFQALISGMILVGIEGGVGYYDFGAALDAAGNPLGAGMVSSRSDIRVDASLYAEWRLQDWLAITGQLGYLGDFTDFQFNRTVMGSTVIDPAGFNKFQAWAGVRAFY